MSLIATLVSSPADPQVGTALIARASAAIGALESRILASDIATEMPVPGTLDASQAERILRDVIADAPVDIAVLPAENRRKRLLIADMDSTMIGQECIDELADFAGLKEHVSAITERAMRGEIAFEPALRERVALLKGLPLSVVADVLTTRITLMPGAVHLVRTMRAHGAYTALVSGGFTVFTGPVREMIGFHEDRSNTLGASDGLLTGSVGEPILGKEAKLASLLELTAKHSLAPGDTLAVGDGANDLAMVKAAGLGVAFRAKPAVAAQARVRIDHADLSALLYIQGYSAAEFADA
jgi:phosphoserine phosphatase